MANTFNKDFQRALESKLALQGSRAGSFDADANLKTAQAGVVGDRARSAIGLEGSQAAFNREKTGLLGRQVESRANLDDQNARATRLGANIDTATGINTLNPARFNAGDFDAFGSGRVFTDPADSPYGGANTTGSIYDNETSGTITGGTGSYGAPLRNDIRYDAYGQELAEGGLVGSPDMGYANGGIVQGAGSPLTAEYELYRAAASKAGVPALPMVEAIPRMAQLRAQKRKGVLDMIAQGGTTPQGYAMGGEIDGPGTGKSDSIPAVVDGVQPAAVSDGEFHIPKHVVDYFGTKMLDGLVEKARMADKANKRKQGAGYACGGAVKRHR